MRDFPNWPNSSCTVSAMPLLDVKSASKHKYDPSTLCHLTLLLKDRTLTPAVFKPTARAALVVSWYISLLKSANPLTTLLFSLQVGFLTGPTIFKLKVRVFDCQYSVCADFQISWFSTSKPGSWLGGF